MGVQLNEALRSLCLEIGWSYAVFWKAIRCVNQMHFVWEDGYYEHKSGSPTISTFQPMDLFLKERVASRSSHHHLFSDLECQTEDRVCSLFYTTMATQVHIMGEGIVGQAAFTGNHQWILQDTLHDIQHVPKVLTEMNHQFSAGIQTIATIPVLPYGVVQLGSTQMVVENIEFVNHVRRLFAQICSLPAALVFDTITKSSDQNIHAHSLHGKPISLNPSGSHGTKIRQFSSVCNRQLPNAPDSSSVLQPWLFTQLFGKVPINASEAPSNIQTACLSSCGLLSLDEQLFSKSGSWKSADKHQTKLNNSGKSHTCLFSSSPKNSEQFDPSKLPNCTNDDLRKYRLYPFNSAESFSNQCPISTSTEAHQMLDLTDHSKSSLMLSGDCRLGFLASIQKFQEIPTEGQHKNNDLFLAPDEQRSCNGSLHSVDPMPENRKNEAPVCAHSDTCTAPIKESSLTPPVQPFLENDFFFDLFGLGNNGGLGSNHDSAFVHINKGDVQNSDVSTCLTQVDTGNIYGAADYERGLFLESSPDQLLDAVVSQIKSGAEEKLDDDLCYKISHHTGSPVYSWLTSSEQIPDEHLRHSPVFIKSEAEGSNSVISACSVDKTGGYSQKVGEHKSQISMSVDQSLNFDKVDEVGKMNRKRARPGENQRPRPKDRQMIQDRIKELREIVPNGAKLSIDTLLEKTIKHMLFLQSVTKHADNMKEVGNPKIMSKEAGLLLEDKFEGGATCAFEVGTQPMTCPIIVEDLNSPRQMLVEILCEERGIFLEIADLIRGLGLTILRGVMEARDDKVWARFMVEANRDVSRMEIFLSLVHMLEPNVGTSLARKGIENLSMPLNIFQQQSILATGMVDR